MFGVRPDVSTIWLDSTQAPGRLKLGIAERIMLLLMVLTWKMFAGPGPRRVWTAPWRARSHRAAAGSVSAL
jgi:hypothetical protein